MPVALCTLAAVQVQEIAREALKDAVRAEVRAREDPDLHLEGPGVADWNALVGIAVAGRLQARWGDVATAWPVDPDQALRAVLYTRRSLRRDHGGPALAARFAAPLDLVIERCSRWAGLDPD